MIDGGPAAATPGAATTPGAAIDARAQRRLMRPRATRIETVSALRLSALSALLQRRGLLANEGIPAHGGAPDPAIGAVRYDSRLIEPGDVFVARRGQHVDGHDHVAAAVAAGAVAVIVERPVPGLQVPELLVRDAKAALALAASWRVGDPSQRLGIVGITGTDGKTTTAYLVRAILEAAGYRTGFVGTTDVIIGGQSLGNAARTSTPEAPELQAYLARMEAAGDTWAVVESTSHGLAQQRVGGVAYDVAVLTNITSEHLEFHGTLEAYREAKQTLFARLARSDENPEKGWGKHAIINADDPQCEVVAAIASAAGAGVLRYGQARRGQAGVSPHQGDGPDLTAAAITETPAGMRAAVQAPGWSGSLELRLAGRFNVAQRPRSHGRGVSHRAGPGCRGRRPGTGRERPRPHAAHRRGAAVQRHRRLRPHRRGPRQGARRAARRPIRQPAASPSSVRQASAT